jgi:ribA/ribD-fused uncharacterized protein
MSTPVLEIRFYSTSDEYGCFSNFHRSPIHLDGKRWPTTEHYFQAQKFAGSEREEQIRLAPTPGEAARLGRSRRHRMRPDWERVKEAVMRKALVAKFTQHEDLRAVLLGTGDALLIEHTANDDYWADGGDGRGRNRLGHLLKSVREELRQADEAGG